MKGIYRDPRLPLKGTIEFRGFGFEDKGLEFRGVGSLGCSAGQGKALVVLQLMHLGFRLDASLKVLTPKPQTLNLKP